MEGTEVVEGPFKQFVFKMATPEDYPKILAHLRKVFYREEPLNKLLGFSEPEFDELDQAVLHYMSLNDNLSFYVEEASTGKVAGVRLTYKCTKTTPLPPFEPKSKLVTVLGIIQTVGGMYNIFEKYGIDFYADLLMTSVDPEFQRQGLVTEIYRRSIALLKAKGYPLCKSTFSSPYTRKAASNLGFEEICRLHFKDYKNEKGEQVMAYAPPDAFGAVMALKLT